MVAGGETFTIPWIWDLDAVADLADRIDAKSLSELIPPKNFLLSLP